ncbi:MAG: hypothetical protein ACT4PL_14380 [Phycisphaerales bacterium]
MSGQAVNIGLGRAVTVTELARSLAERCRTPHLQPRHEAARVGDVPHSLADITLARALIGYQPVVTLEQGLDEVVAFHRKALAET